LLGPRAAENLGEVTSATTLDDEPLNVVPLERPRAQPDRFYRDVRTVSPREYVPRSRLINSLERESARPLVLLTAPAGYGKTIVLRQWEAVSERAFVWVTADADDREPMRLTRSVALAMGGTATCSPRHRRRRVVVVLDNAHLIEPTVLETVVPVVLGWLPEGSQLVLGSRCKLPLRLGCMRADRRVLEVGVQELSMSPDEGAELLAQAGPDLDPVAAEALVRHTGGWPVALELAALSCGRLPGPPDRAPVISGDDHLLSEYFRAEILASLSPATVRFLTLSSVLERLSGPLCDAVLQRRGSGTMLAELERASAPLAPVDASHEWYRLDTLFREMLQTELRRTEPELQAVLHARASAWYEREGDLDSAIDHARSSDDLPRTAALLWSELPRYLSEGRNTTVQHWLGGRSTDSSLPRLALVAAHTHLAAGNVTVAEQCARSASAGLTGVAEDSTQAERAGILIVEAWMARSGVTAMGEAAARSYDLLSEDSPWRASCCFLGGSAALLAGAVSEAERLLQEGAARGAVVALDAAALCLAQLAVVAAERDQPEAASDYARRAGAIVTEHHLTGYPTCALVAAVCAVEAIRERRVDEAKAAASECLRLLEALDDSLCWYGAEARILLAQVSLALGDVPSARARLADASRLVRRTPDVALFARWFDEAWNQFDMYAETALAGVATLTTAELRVLRFLPTHYSFHEIAERLHVSANTVKTHVHAVYRKLDASSRSEAVAHAIQAGLLGS
jgi:LuxR family transcriptional regulator, maltose regulon positive regulatory protein